VARARRCGGAVLGRVAVVLCIVCLVTATWGGAYSAFTSATQATATFTSGTVSLTDDDSTSTLFSVANLAPGATGTKCIKVTYGGSIAAAVRVYGAGYTSTNALGAYLNLSVEEGSGATFAGSGPSSCPGFTPSSTLYAATLDDFGATKTSYASGVGSFAPTAANQMMVYRFTYTLDPSAPEGTQSGSAAVAFTWTATNT